MHPSIDHTLLSPSGRVSKRARKAALEREAARLFPPGFWDRPAASVNRREQLLRAAKDLRELAGRGMSTKKYLREAVRLEAEAEALTR